MLPYVFLLSILFSSLAWSSPAEDPEEWSIPVMDSTQDFFGDNLNALANRVDSFFATERADDELGRSTVRISRSYTSRERELPFEETRYRINFRLPHLEEKFRYDFYRDLNKSDEQIITEEKARKTARRNRVKTGWLFNADAGVSLAIPPKLVNRARLRRNFSTGDFIHRFAEELTYITDSSGLFEETSLHSDFQLGDTMLFRFINTKQWRVLKKEFVTIHGPTLLHQLTEDDGFNYQFLMANVIIDKIFFVTGYTFSINYRRNVYKNWVYLDIIPGVDFPKHWSFRRTPFITFQIELLFGG